MYALIDLLPGKTQHENLQTHPAPGPQDNHRSGSVWSELTKCKKTQAVHISCLRHPLCAWSEQQISMLISSNSSLYSLQEQLLYGSYRLKVFFNVQKTWVQNLAFFTVHLKKRAFLLCWGSDFHWFVPEFLYSSDLQTWICWSVWITVQFHVLHSSLNGVASHLNTEICIQRFV